MAAEKQLDQCGKADGEFLTNVGVRVVLVVPEMVVKELTVDRQRNRDYGHGLAGVLTIVEIPQSRSLKFPFTLLGSSGV